MSRNLKVLLPEHQPYYDELMKLDPAWVCALARRLPFDGRVAEALYPPAATGWTEARFLGWAAGPAPRDPANETGDERSWAEIRERRRDALYNPESAAAIARARHCRSAVYCAAVLPNLWAVVLTKIADLRQKEAALINTAVTIVGDLKSRESTALLELLRNDPYYNALLQYKGLRPKDET
jgi:hypothetical protein